MANHLKVENGGLYRDIRSILQTSLDDTEKGMEAIVNLRNSNMYSGEYKVTQERELEKGIENSFIQTINNIKERVENSKKLIMQSVISVPSATYAASVDNTIELKVSNIISLLEKLGEEVSPQELSQIAERFSDNYFLIKYIKKVGYDIHNCNVVPTFQTTDEQFNVLDKIQKFLDEMLRIHPVRENANMRIQVSFLISYLEKIIL